MSLIKPKTLSFKYFRVIKKIIDYKVEVACPIYNKEIQKELKNFMEMQFKGNVKSRIVNGEKNNTYREIESEPFRTQYEIYSYFKNKTESLKPIGK